jgi:uncharacterized protein (TIGR03083 family)
MKTVFADPWEIPQTPPDRVAEVAAAELDAELALLGTLDELDWHRPTDCVGWDVHDLTAHLVGEYEEITRPWVLLRRLREGHRRYPRLSRLDAHNQQQINELGRQSGPDLITALAQLAPAAIRARRRLPGPLRRLPVARLFPEEARRMPDVGLGYLLDVIMVRDVWMHRVDLARAIGRPLALGEHDREVVAQVVRDVGRRWGGPAVLLELTGPAGGRWRLGDGAPAATVRADAVGYLRAVSGRDDHPALEADGDLAAVAAVAAARLVF